MTRLREKMLETGYYNQSERKKIGDWLLRPVGEKKCWRPVIMTSLREKMLETGYYEQSERKDVGDRLL